MSDTSKHLNAPASPEKSNIQVLLGVFMALGLLAIFSIGAIGWWASSDLTKTVNSIGEDSLSLAKVNLSLSNTVARYLDRHEDVSAAESPESLNEYADKSQILQDFSDIYQKLDSYLSKNSLIEAAKFQTLQIEFDQADDKVFDLKNQLLLTEKNITARGFEMNALSKVMLAQAQAVEADIREYQRVTGLKDEKRFFGGQSKEGKHASQLVQAVSNQDNYDSASSNILEVYIGNIIQAANTLSVADSKSQIQAINADIIQPKYDALAAVLADISIKPIPVEGYSARIDVLKQQADQLLLIISVSTESLLAFRLKQLAVKDNLSTTKKHAGDLHAQLVLQLEALTHLSDEVGQRAREKANTVVAKTQQLTLIIACGIIVVFLVFGRLITAKIGGLMVRLRQHASHLQLAHDEIDHAHKELQDSNRVVTESIYYASKIQRAILTSKQAIAQMLGPKSYFALWEPRDVVGGDMFWIKSWGEGQLIALADCTGHGVPGAFMTILVKSALDQAMSYTAPGDTADLAGAIHVTLQTDLGQHQGDGDSDDGLDLALLYIPNHRKHLVFTGARMSLLIQVGDSIEQLKGDRLSIGYRNLPSELCFSQTEQPLNDLQRLFLFTDGLTDQVGGDKRIGFGTRRLKRHLQQLKDRPITEYEPALWSALNDYQINETRRDDVTILGVEVERKLSF